MGLGENPEGSQSGLAVETFRRAFDDAPIAMAIVGLDGTILRANQQLVTLTGFTAEGSLFMDPEELAHPDDAGLNEDQRQRAIDGHGDIYRIEKLWTNASGDQIWVGISASLIRDEDDRPLFFVSHIEDRSVKRHEEHRLRHIADHDALTGLPNRRFLYETVGQQLARARRYGESSALLVLDLDGFKAVNDSLGHATGDEVLKATTRALTGRARDTDVVARLGGDEFAVLVLHVDEEHAQRVAEELREAVDESLAEASGGISVTGSLGCTMITAKSASVDEVLGAADAAMYASKRGGAARRFSR